MENFHAPRMLVSGPVERATPPQDPNDEHYQRTYTKILGISGPNGPEFYLVTYKPLFGGGEAEINRVKQ